MSEQELEPQHRNIVRKLVFAVVGMFGFAFAMVPLYEVLCEVTGLNGKTNSRAITQVPEGMAVDEERSVLVQFVTRNDPDMPWAFEPMEHSVRVHPGEIKAVNFRVRNDTDQDMVSQAIPSLVPGQAASHFKKTQCFCFDQQPLAANSEQIMPMIFYLDPALPKHLTTITLSYTLFDITDRVNGRAGEVAAR